MDADLIPCPQPPRCARGDFVAYWEGGTAVPVIPPRKLDAYDSTKGRH